VADAIVNFGPIAGSKATAPVDQPIWGDARGKPAPNSVSIATAVPGDRQQQLAIAVVLIVIAAFVSLTPFATIRLARVDSFIPVTQAIIMVTDLLTAVLLFNLVLFIYSHPVLVLANGYLFSALIVIPHSLSFPGGGQCDWPSRSGTSDDHVALHFLALWVCRIRTGLCSSEWWQA
jgi:hypothetical protein